MPMNQMMQGPSIPARDPRMNPQIPASPPGVSYERILDEIYDDPEIRDMFQRAVAEKLQSRRYSNSFLTPRQDLNLVAAMVANQIFGRGDLTRGRNARPDLAARSDYMRSAMSRDERSGMGVDAGMRDRYLGTIDEMAGVGASRRLTQRGYNAP